MKRGAGSRREPRCPRNKRTSLGSGVLGDGGRVPASISIGTPGEIVDEEEGVEIDEDEVARADSWHEECDREEGLDEEELSEPLCFQSR